MISEFQMSLFAGMIVTSALIIWKGLMVVTGSESPVVVVLSGSMEPGFKRVCYLLAQLDTKI
jgi:signal peptidase I